jgi:hypothetical protein
MVWLFYQAAEQRGAGICTRDSISDSDAGGGCWTECKPADRLKRHPARASVIAVPQADA